MFIDTALNNLLVLCIYASAGLVVRFLTGSKLAYFAPWAVYGIHILQVAIQLLDDFKVLGTLPCLALVLPHAWLELAGYTLGCWAGNCFCRGKLPLKQMTIAATLIIIGAYTEVFITPFPLESWLH